ncbi:hypothetical protein [Lyngbya confervoides]|uniref:Esterase n=1 Tax=Lyngbya confervoides BDU141951 TaxID=1574623 RepID=A0ABD4T8D6_9CYAN|nr:hypothetical protein [Lyngbya confervoides]MCM1984550.1 hypothetical protein [Lyngbya confervoides BDU141951]
MTRSFAAAFAAAWQRTPDPPPAQGLGDQDSEFLPQSAASADPWRRRPFVALTCGPGGTQIIPGDHAPPGHRPPSEPDHSGQDHSVYLGFSAGVIPALKAAQIQRLRGRSVLGLMAWDGWGVPLGGAVPAFRFSHDVWSDLTAALLGGERTFFADPPISHLDLWRSPTQARGWYRQPFCQGRASGSLVETTAIEALVDCIDQLLPIS